MDDKDTFFSKKRMLNLRGNLFELESPVVMGIVNVTPDSFYAESRFNTEEAIIAQVQKIIDDGGWAIDVGAYSSRANATNIPVDEEKQRLSLALSVIRKKYPDVIISVDTFRASIAEWVVKEFGVDIINDISAGNLDAEMFKTILQLQVPYILMHMRGTPQDMQQNPVYENVAKEVITELSQKVRVLQNMGVNDLIIDPGFGFAKTVEHNFMLLDKLDLFKIFELPILVGLSRKSMIYKTLGTTPEQSLNGTTVLNTIALTKGADILRVHDVKEAVETINLVKMMK